MHAAAPRHGASSGAPAGTFPNASRDIPERSGVRAKRFCGGHRRDAATFVHLAPASAAARIRRSGIRRHRTRLGFSGVCATPVMRSFFATHQWLRELKRSGHSRIVAVYFRIPDAEVVEVGHYGRAHAAMTAAEAIAFVSGMDDPLGYYRT